MRVKTASVLFKALENYCKEGRNLLWDFHSVGVKRLSGWDWLNP